MEVRYEPLNVSVVLDNILCIDEGDGAGNAEPYLWTLFFKIDGDTTHITSLQEGGNLRGICTVNRRNGGHGNLLNRDVDAGDNLLIPPSLGRWDTTLTPIPHDVPIDLFGTIYHNSPSTIGVVCVLMEENFVVTSAIRAGYDAFCSTFEVKLNEKINTLGVLNRELSEDSIKEITDAVSTAATDAAENSLNFAGKIGAWLFGQDQQLGNANFRRDSSQLAGEGQYFFDVHWKLGHTVDADWVAKIEAENPFKGFIKKGEWKLFGHMSATPVPQFIGEFGPIIAFDQEEMAMRDFRHRAEVAEREGFAGGFPNFYTATYGRNNVGGTIFITAVCGEGRDVRLVDLGNPPLDDFVERFRATHLYATKNGFVGGFPNFFHADYSTLISRNAIALPPKISNFGGSSALNPLKPVRLKPVEIITMPSILDAEPTVCGTVLVKSSCATFRDVLLTELGNPSLSDIGARFRATQDYATNQGFVGGFPTFFHADYGNGIVCGTILLKPGAAEWRDVLLWLGPA